MTLEARLQAVWYGTRPPGWGLRALAAAYAALISVRHALYRGGWLKSRRLPVPVLVVGNRVAGGSGKTPLVLALVEHFRSRGRSPGIASRGHGRRSSGLVAVDARTDPDRGGDEPVLLARRSGVPVAVCAQRHRAGEWLVERGCDLIVADDGLQHLALARDLEIEVLDGERRHGNGRLLPAGPQREQPPERFDGLRVVNGGRAAAGEWPMHLRGTRLHPLGGGGAPVGIDALRDRLVHAVAGVGNPQRFFRTLADHGLQVIEHRFPDHHRYRAADLRFGPAAAIVMTEKDAVKCRAFAPPDSWYLEVSAELPADFYVEVEARLWGRRGD